MKNSLLVKIKKYKFRYILLSPAIVLTFVLGYMTFPGILMAFQDYNPFRGLTGSPWVGLKHIRDFFQTPMLTKSIWNTLKLSLLSIVICYPAPIIFALMLNELKNEKFKRLVQTVSYLPYFISMIAVIGLFTSLFSEYGTINDIRVALFGEDTERILFLAKQELFVPNILLITIWKTTGYSTIIYLATLSAIDPQLYEAAYIDGATKIKQMYYITIPGLVPTMLVILIFNMGGLFNSNFELVYGLQNTYIDFEVISTVVFKQGIQNASYSLATAVGFVQGLIAFILILIANWTSRKYTGLSVF